MAQTYLGLAAGEAYHRQGQNLDAVIAAHRDAASKFILYHHDRAGGGVIEVCVGGIGPNVHGTVAKEELIGPEWIRARSLKIHFQGITPYQWVEGECTIGSVDGNEIIAAQGIATAFSRGHNQGHVE